jgi:uncharacterized integral membrane protein
MNAQQTAPTTHPAAPAGDRRHMIESRGNRLRRHGRRARLYTWLVLFVALLVVLIVLIGANIRTVKLDWVLGSTQASLVWIILASTVLGWLLGIATSILLRFRTRRPVA